MDHESGVSSELLIAKNIPLKHQPTHEIHSENNHNTTEPKHPGSITHAPRRDHRSEDEI